MSYGISSLRFSGRKDCTTWNGRLSRRKLIHARSMRARIALFALSRWERVGRGFDALRKACAPNKKGGSKSALQKVFALLSSNAGKDACVPHAKMRALREEAFAPVNLRSRSQVSWQLLQSSLPHQPSLVAPRWYPKNPLYASASFQPRPSAESSYSFPRRSRLVQSRVPEFECFHSPSQRVPAQLVDRQ